MDSNQFAEAMLLKEKIRVAQANEGQMSPEYKKFWTEYYTEEYHKLCVAIVEKIIQDTRIA